MRMIACLTLFLMPVAAHAESFAGPHAALIAGYDQTDVGPSLGAASGVLYGVTGGYDFALAGVRLGGEAEIAESTAKATITGAEQRVGRSLYVGARFGVPLGDAVLIYAKGGYANGRFSGVTPYTGNGFRIGGGGEIALSRRLFARTEYRYSDYGRQARGQHWIIAVGTRF